jgi:L-threonylcarbamoyladenylate synthase
MARDCVAEWPAAAAALAKAFWPGPLTLVLPKAEVIPDNVTAGGETVGVRWPRHPLMQEVIRACRFPLAAPSANVANQVSPTTADHVAAQLDGRIPLIINGGAAEVGIESTVVEVVGDAVRGVSQRCG